MSEGTEKGERRKEKWELRRLGDVCHQDRQVIAPTNKNYNSLPYFGLEDIESQTGRMIGTSKSQDDIYGNTFYFDERHVLYGKLRPYLNKVALPTIQGRSSTELVPLLPTPELNREYLANFLRSPKVVNQITLQSSGARMPRADMNVLLDFAIPIPSLPEQEKIVARLNVADALRRKQAAAQAVARRIIPALFHAMFGDPATNPMGWEVVKVGDIIHGTDYGTSQKANENNNGIPVLRMGNVTMDGELVLDSLKYLDLSEKEYEKYALQAGDILFNRTNSKELVGKTGLWDERYPAVAASYFIRVRVIRSHIDPTYFWLYFNLPYMKKRLFNTARGAIGQANINTTELRGFDIPLPPLALQQQFAARVAAVRRLETRLADSAALIERTFQSLLAQAFG